MGLNFSFFRTPKHRVFNYTPIYYDEKKEMMEGIKNEALREKAKREGTDWRNDRYIPGKSIRGSIRSANAKNRRHSMGSSTRKIVTIVSILATFIVMFYFAQYFGWLTAALFQ